HENLCATDEPDIRSHAQRQHDAINVLVRGQLGDPKLGVHNGLPVTVVVSTTLQELSSATGQAVTGGGTLLPMRDLIRMASGAYHYLAVFDEHENRPLYLGRARRIASADQPPVLFAKDQSCTRPGCGGRRDIDRWTLGCKLDHKLVDKGWRTIKLESGSTQWIPPPHLDHGQARVNDYHHPERFFGDKRSRE